MILAHSLIGVPITKLVITKSNKSYSLNFLNFSYFVGIISSVLPDFDLLLSFFIDDLNHRKLISHSLLPYLALFIFILFLSRFFPKYKNELNVLNLIYILCVSSHLLLDYLVGGIVLLSPLSSGVYGFPIFFPINEYFIQNYFTSRYILFEIPLIIYSLIVIKNIKNIYVPKILPFIFLISAIVMLFIVK